MGLGFRVALRLGFPVQSRFVTSSPSRFVSSSAKGWEASLNVTRLPLLSVISDEGDTLFKDPIRTHAANSFAIPTLENECLESEVPKVIADESCFDAGDAKVSFEEPSSSADTISREKGLSRFGLLLENLVILEESFNDASALKLEKDILLQLGRLGALEFFNNYLSRSLETLNMSDSVHTRSIGEHKTIDGHGGKITVSSGKKGMRKSVKARAASKVGDRVTSLTLLSKKIKSAPGKSKNRRLMIAKNEAEMARAVKVVSSLERIRDTLEKQSEGLISLSCWAKAAGMDEKLLQQNLHFGWYCRDELLRSTRSLVLYIARNYRGMGISWEDLLQVGNMGVLKGAEKFDQARGNRFSTYVHYWIKKEMLRYVTQHARGIQVPWAVNQAVNRIQRARKTLSNSNGKYPDDNEIAKFTGLSLAKIESASRCLRIVGSIDQKPAPCMKGKYLDFFPDMSIQSPEAVAMRRDMKRDISEILQQMDSRERQVLILRYGFKDHQPKSLEEIGRALKVSKEWVRRIEMKLISRLRDEEVSRNLTHYINL